MAMPSQYDPAQIEMFLVSRIQERILSAQQQTAAGNQAVLDNLKVEAGTCITACAQSVSECAGKMSQLGAAAVHADARISGGLLIPIKRSMRRSCSRVPLKTRTSALTSWRQRCGS